MLELVPAYTLDTLDQCGLERLINYYLWHYRKQLAQAQGFEDSDNVVTRNGKKYKKVNASEASWLNSIF